MKSKVIPYFIIFYLLSSGIAYSQYNTKVVLKRYAFQRLQGGNWVDEPNTHNTSIYIFKNSTSVYQNTNSINSPVNSDIYTYEENNLSTGTRYIIGLNQFRVFHTGRNRIYQGSGALVFEINESLDLGKIYNEEVIAYESGQNRNTRVKLDVTYTVLQTAELTLVEISNPLRVNGANCEENVTLKSIYDFSPSYNIQYCWQVSDRNDGGWKSLHGTTSLIDSDGNTYTPSISNSINYIPSISDDLGTGRRYYRLRYYQDNIFSNSGINSHVVYPSAPSFVPVDTTEISCNGASDGSIIIDSNNIIGGVPPYYTALAQVIENDIFPLDFGLEKYAYRNLGAGDYILRVVNEDRQCIADDFMTNVYEPEPLLIVHHSEDFSCFDSEDGLVELEAFGGNAGYQFSLDNGTSYLPPSIDGGNKYTQVPINPGSYTLNAKDQKDCPVQGFFDKTTTSNFNPPYTYTTSAWSACNPTTFKQTRSIQDCVDKDGNMAPNTAFCKTLPLTTRNCGESIFDEPYNWDIGDWGPCDEQGNFALRERSVRCKNARNEIVNDNKCPTPKPVTLSSEEECIQCNTLSNQTDCENLNYCRWLSSSNRCRIDD